LNHKEIKDIADRLLIWMKRENFCGWDPFDGLNSPFLQGISRINHWFGIAALQAVKHSPLNLRPFLFVQKTINAKGIGLILAALVRRYQTWGEEIDMTAALKLGTWLEENISRGFSGACWGYPFDWPNRAFYAPKGTPTVVNTSFIGHAVLDLFEATGEERWLMLAQSASEFISQDLNRSLGDKGFCFSYTPRDWSRVHNANLLGASLIARLGKIAKRSDLLDIAMESTSFSIKAQRSDGSWPYGEAPDQTWIDSFHTGYNLICLKQIYGAINDDSLQKALNIGYFYYLDHFFLSDGTVKYYHDKIEPLDAHAFAHAVICLSEMNDYTNTLSGLAQKVIERMIELFWSEKGYFYWQRCNGFLYRMPCMRWVQAWVLLSLAKYLLDNPEA